MKNRIIVASIALLGLISCGDEGGLNLSPYPPSVQPTALREDVLNYRDTVPVDVTLDQYNQVRVGMSSSEVINILGVPTTKTTVTLANFQSDRYSWKNSLESGAVINAVFINDLLDNKDQIGLR